MRVSRSNQATPVVWYIFVRNKLDAKTARGGGTKSNELRSATRAPWRFPVRRHPFAPIKAAIFLRRPVSLVAPCLKIRFRSLREIPLPCILKFGAGLVEGGRGAVCAFALNGSPDRSRSSSPRDLPRAACRCGARSRRPARRRNRRASILHGHRESGGG